MYASVYMHMDVTCVGCVCVCEGACALTFRHDKVIYGQNEAGRHAMESSEHQLSKSKCM